MKKIFKHLIPIIGSVSITTPFLVSCNEDSSRIELNKTELDLNKGESERLIATVYPEGTTSEVYWRSKDESIAKVEDDGLVVAIATGETTITAISSFGDEANCTVTVSKYDSFELERITRHGIDYYLYRSHPLDIKQGNYFKFYIKDFVEGGNVKLAFSKQSYTPPFLTVDWIVDKLVINGNETTEYSIDTTNVWTMTFAAPEHSKIEFYMQANDTYTEDKGMAFVNWYGPW